MTQLPVKYHDTEMLAAALEWIEEQRQFAFHPDADLKAKDMMKRFAQFHPDCALDIIYLARHNNEPADAVLCELWRELATENKLHVPLQAYMIERNKQEFDRKNTGQPRAANFMRDMGITGLVTFLQERFGLKLYKNPASHKPTASTIAAQALREAGIVGPSFSPGAVEQVWKRFAPFLNDLKYPTPPLCGPYGEMS
jgi:hypothetical protein